MRIDGLPVSSPSAPVAIRARPVMHAHPMSIERMAWSAELRTTTPTVMASPSSSANAKNKALKKRSTRD